MTTLLGGNVAMTILVGGSISTLWGMINSLQVISAIPMFNIVRPYNMELVLAIVVTVV